MAWDSDDLSRSIRKYLSMTLDGPPWTIRVERREVRDDERPVAVIDVGPQLVTRARESVPQGEWEWVAPVTVTCYPKPGKDQRQNAYDARALRTQLFRLITNGLNVTGADGKRWSGPFRIPLWDYVDVPLSGAEKGTDEDPHDVAWVERESLTAEVIPDDDDPDRWTVVLEFRASVEAPGAVPVPPEGDGTPVTGFTDEGYYVTGGCS